MAIINFTASAAKELKARIDAEARRRKYAGSLVNKTTDFEVEPKGGEKILAEQGQKIVNLALEIGDIDGLALVHEGDLLPNLDLVSEALDV